MDSTGGFHEVEWNGKPILLVYHHPKYNPIPQTQNSLISYDESASHDDSSQLLFLCPIVRVRQLRSYINSSPEYVISETTKRDKNHHVLHLFNNENFDVDDRCHVCRDSNLGTDYYFCEYHKTKYHKECVESPLQIKHPYHPKHSLILRFSEYPSVRNIHECLCCARKADFLVYSCEICQVLMHTVCAMESIPFVMNNPKRHDHPLIFFPRQASLICNVCGSLRQNPTYLCLRCNFVAHNNCMYYPRIIKITRHKHRISYISSLQSDKWSCGVCREELNSEYGAYICDKCSDYVVHSNCALRKDVCDGEELENVPEKDDITQDAPPFSMISEGVIHYFLHDHYLLLERNIPYDENKLCQLCVLPISEGNLYSCMECCFILHETCAKSSRRIQHVLHPHPLTLKAKNGYSYSGVFICDACGSYRSDFLYQCPIRECEFGIDVRCAFISEPFDYQGHKHPLFLSLGPEEKLICEVCQKKCYRQLNCIKCYFIVCIKCATLPHKVRYKHDNHFLTFLWRKYVSEEDWCEVCEDSLIDASENLFYWCIECCTTLHIDCILDYR